MAVNLGGTRLWQIQESRLESQGNVRVDSIFSEQSDQALLTGLESIEQFQFSGIATAPRLSGVTGYASDPRTAMAQWVAEMEAYVDGAQGTGYTLESDERGRTLNVVLDQFGWQITEGGPYQVDWDLSGIWGRGIQVSGGTSPDTVSPGGTPQLGDRELPGVLQAREQKQMEIEPYPIAFAGPGQNETMASSGAMKRITIHGQNTGSRAERNDFDNYFLERVGQDTTLTYQSEFPGREITCMIENYEPVRESGVVRKGEYIIDMWEGTGATRSIPGNGGGTGDTNVASELPSRAVSIYNNAPADARNQWPTEDVTSYAGRNGDLANGVNSTASGSIADLGTGNTYEISSPIDVDTVVGLAGENCTIVVNMEGRVMPLGGSGHSEFALQGVTWDLSETTDAAVLTTHGAVQDYIYVRDVTISGPRGRQVAGGGEPHTFLVQVGPNGEAYVDNYVAPDGSTEVTGVSDNYASGAAADPDHEGYAVWRNCFVGTFLGNGYYMQNAPGTSVLWGCEAVNNGRTNMRLGAGDIVVGGRAEINNNYPHSEQLGTLLGGNGNRWGDVVGLELVAEGSMWGSAGIRTWTGAVAGGEGGPIRRSTYHIRSGSSPAFRIHSDRDPNLDLQDVWILDESGSTVTFDVADWASSPGTVVLHDNVRLDSNTGAHFRVGSNGTLVAPNGSSYQNQDLSASSIGVDASISTSDFPAYYVDITEGDS